MMTSQQQPQPPPSATTTTTTTTRKKVIPKGNFVYCKAGAKTKEIAILLEDWVQEDGNTAKKSHRRLSSSNNNNNNNKSRSNGMVGVILIKFLIEHLSFFDTDSPRGKRRLRTNTYTESLATSSALPSSSSQQQSHPKRI